MPVYDYKCPKCDYIRGELRSLSEDGLDQARSDCQMCDLPMLIVNEKELKR